MWRIAHHSSCSHDSPLTVSLRVQRKGLPFASIWRFDKLARSPSKEEHMHNSYTNVVQTSKRNEGLA